VGINEFAKEKSRNKAAGPQKTAEKRPKSAIFLRRRVRIPFFHHFYFTLAKSLFNPSKKLSFSL
jgi:hypothetical protein